jgi:hypothetical protein
MGEEDRIVPRHGATPGDVHLAHQHTYIIGRSGTGEQASNSAVLPIVASR